VGVLAKALPVPVGVGTRNTTSYDTPPFGPKPGRLEAEHQSILRDVLSAGDFWGVAGLMACQLFITESGRNF
jgi:hypothetical protein